MKISFLDFFFPGVTKIIIIKAYLFTFILHTILNSHTTKPIKVNLENAYQSLQRKQQ